MLLFHCGITSFRAGLVLQTSFLIHPNCSIPSDASVYKDEVLTLLAVAITIPSAIFSELL